ncbi:hypothetical protein GO730_30870 [Spirosoma sp. HMF3257]|nr:hypothetical protein [Spirosoma telluris]
MWYNENGYQGEGNTLSVTQAGKYYAKCTSGATCNECTEYCEGASSGTVVVTSCPPTGCNLSITGLTNGQTIATTCNNGVTLTGTCTGSDCTGASATWSGAGGWSSIGLSATTPAQTATSKLPYTLTLVKGACTSSITIYVSTTGCTPVDPCAGASPPTSPSSTQGDSKCSGSSFSLSASGCSSSYRWYTVSSGGSSFNSSSSYSPVLSTVGTTTYYVSCSNACGESVTRTPVSATVTTCQTPCTGMPTPTITSQTVVSGTTVTWTLTAQNCAPGQSVRWYRVGQGNFIPDENPKVFTNPEANMSVYAKCVNGACLGDASNSLTYNTTTPVDPCAGASPPASPSSTQGESKCSGSTFSLSASGCSSSYGWYTTTSGGAHSLVVPVIALFCRP